MHACSPRPHIVSSHLLIPDLSFSPHFAPQESIFSLLLLCVSIAISFFHSSYSVSWVYVERSFLLLRCFLPIYGQMYIVKPSLLIALASLRVSHASGHVSGFTLERDHIRDLHVYLYIRSLSREDRDER